VKTFRLPLWLRAGRWLALCAVLAALPACSLGVGVRRARTPPLLAAWRASALEKGELSPRTLQTLRQLDLANPYRRDPAIVYARLHELAVADPQPDLLFALAEISYQLGCRAEKCKDCEAIAYHYFCAGYAYHYLFGGDRGPGTGEREERIACRLSEDPAADPRSLAPNLSPLLAVPRPLPAAFDPRFRLACDLYNAALAKCIRAAQGFGRLDPRQQLHLPTRDGKGFTLSVVHHGFAWQPEEFGPLQFCSDYEVVGLDNHFRTFGLGVPLICTRAGAACAARCSAFYPREVSFPVTAFFRFEGSIADLGACRAGRLELHNPLAAQSVAVAGRAVPLETDLTTPLAYFLEKTDLEDAGFVGFLRAEKLRDRAGIYLFEPYQPGKIPVVMAHGLLSSPLTWTPLFNELRADPELREHFQFWFYLYPTGNPYLATAADLRDALKRLRAEVDPKGRDPALDQMVFVGHSMGGLIAKLLTQDSGDAFWNLVSTQPFETVKASPQTKAALQRIFYFERQPCVRRVIFLGTPHHGSNLSAKPVAALLARFMRLPRQFVEAAKEVATNNPDLWPTLGKDPHSRDIPNSLNLLTPGAPALQLLAARSAPAQVRYHSVIGVVIGGETSGSDGVVTYRSAHIEGVDSEMVIPAHHTNVHHHPRAVLEVKRILREHLRAVRGEGQGIVPASLRLEDGRAGGVSPRR
jgi:pimeloyl-ACP methyl ester carboxylesterase